MPPPKPVLKLTPIPPVGPSPITPDCRYLFVVDTSAAMQRSADGLYRATHRLVATGLGGRMQEGDVFTVWTYADTVLTREFPLNAWTRDLNIALANRTYEFLAQQKFRGKSNLRPVFAELGQALVIATNLTVILISDGTDVVVGTPFDRPINVLYGKRASEMRSAKMPFLTALVTRHGEFTHWAVRGGLEDLGLPFPEPPPLPVPASVLAPAVVTPPPTPIPVVFTPPPPPKLADTTNGVPKPAPPGVTNPIPVVAKAPDAVTPQAAPKPPSVPSAAPPAVTNVVAAPKPTPPPAPAPSVPAVKKAEPIPSPTPKPEPKPAPPVPPKTIVTLAPATASPPPLTLPSPRPPQSVLDASNALARVELLRPTTGTSAPPAAPLAARPAPPKATNATAVAPPLPPVAKPLTNPPPAAAAALVPVPRVVPSTPPSPPTVPKPPEAPTPAPATNTVARPASPAPATAPLLPKAEAHVESKAPVAAPAQPVAASKPALTETNKPSPTPPPPAASTGTLAVTPGPDARSGWVYLAAALGLLIVAGGIIAHLLRPRPQPSAISQSLDDQRG